MHLLTASNFFVDELNSFSVFDPHEGQLVGKLNFFEFFFLLLRSTSITCGITSPALSINIVSPILIYIVLGK